MLTIPITKTKYSIYIEGKVNKYKKLITNKIVTVVLEHQKIKNNNEIEIKYCTVEEIKKYKLEFKNKEEACDVLSLKFNEVNNNPKNLIGVILICEEIIKEDLEYQNSINTLNQKTYLQHLIHLIVHSTLHILGYDHENPKEKQSMEDKEITILSKIGISNPYNNK